MTSPPNFDLAIDASRNRSGGAIAHLVGLIGAGRPELHGIGKVHVWSYARLLNALPDRPWLVRHNPAALERGIISQLLWQRFRLPREVRAAGCAITLNTDAGTIARHRPCATMSRDMLSYEPGEIQRYRYGKARLRLWLLRGMQNRSLRHADGAIFLTRYAAEMIQRAGAPARRVAVIPHGIGEIFCDAGLPPHWPRDGERPVRILYVSNVAPYKHQWHVVRAVALLREQDYDVRLVLAGGGAGPAAERLDRELVRSDPTGSFVERLPFLSHGEIAMEMGRADMFLFASSCENMPNTLVEGMASGLPVACARRGPMPEVLGDAGSYFDPEDPDSIAAAIRRLIDDEGYRTTLAAQSHKLSRAFSWSRCADETFAFLRELYQASSAGAPDSTAADGATA
jgi:glycosyltransferase involved in cell wall biosynthesis